ncbi:MAG: cytochrome c3 family protein [Acidobacteria bacterium]|nr:cytochrome c3 family protein [Acidobacteriota bacterium]
MSRFHPMAWVLLALFPAALANAQAPALPATSCTTCHSDTDLFEGAAATLVSDFANDVHAEIGLSCHDCHGGNPDPSLADDMFAAKDEEQAEHPFVGAPERTEIPAFCGRCHSDPVTMARFKPGARTDQEALYWTSRHGKLLKQGDMEVATCTDCHGVHGIRRPVDPLSTVHPKRVAETCGGCHGDAQRMAGRTLPDGRPLPVDQLARWTQSVHAEAMFKKEDLSAPTCNDCHGNHGATPPGVGSVAFVCGQCHGREAELFRRSVKRDGLLAHGELLADAGTEGCAACHEPPEPQAQLVDIRSLVECETCHGNHLVARASVAMLSPLPEVPCAFCHEGTSEAVHLALESERGRQHYVQVREELVQEGKAAGLSGDALFDWLVDQALELPFHTASSEAEEGQTLPLRPEFADLFRKFRIGKTTHRIIDPATGKEAVIHVRRCSSCHAQEPQLADAPVGLTTAEALSSRMREMTALTASAERQALSARRGGVETHEALADVEQAVATQIRLEALVHTFSTEGEFDQAYQEGIQQANSALDAGRRALEELGRRRKGLVVALVLVLLALVALALKIRQLSAGEE